MADMLLRDLDEETKRRIQERAAENGRSQSAEACAALKAAYAPESSWEESWIFRLRKAALEVGGVDLELPEWAAERSAVDFSGPEYD